MNIGINATILHEKPSGLGIYTINIIKELSKISGNKHKIIVYTATPKLFENLDVEIRKAPKYVSPRFGKFGGLFRFLWTQFILPYKIKKDKLDLIYATTHHGSFYGDTPQIITIHDILPINFPDQHKLQYYYFKYITPILLKKTVGLVTVSENTKKDIVAQYSFETKPIEIIYNSFDRNHFTNKNSIKFKDKYGDYILFLGASYPHKNLDRAIKAFLDIQKRNPEINLVIAGGNKSYRDSVLKQLEEEFMGTLKNINIIDYVKYDDLPILYSNALALFYPSLYEGFGIPPLEAMACGCPSVVSRTSSLPEVCGSAGCYINPTDIPEMAEALERIINDNNFRSSLIEKGFLNIERFSWSASANKLMGFFEDINKQEIE